jgi:hypothetical protein
VGGQNGGGSRRIDRERQKAEESKDECKRPDFLTAPAAIIFELLSDSDFCDIVAMFSPTPILNR